MILRFQDRSGRGPFRPGIPAMWSDAEGASPPAVFERFPALISNIERIHAAGGYVGCACIGWDGLDRYFTQAEQDRLYALGYRIHRVPNSAVIMSDDDEAVFVSWRPLKELPRAHRKQGGSW